MTTFELTWQEDNNRVPSQSTATELSKYLIWYPKALLMGNVTLKDSAGSTIGSPQGLWTCAGSSDASTGGMDGVDRWGTSFDATKLTRANADGSAHSWMVLRNVGLGIYLLLDYVNGSGTDNGFRVFISKTAYSGGSATARPTTSNEVTMNNASALNSTPGAGAASHVHGRIATDGQFLVLYSRDGTNFFNFALSVRALTETRAGDNHNAWLFQEYDDSSGVLRNVGAHGSANTTGSGWHGRSADATTAIVGAHVELPYNNAGTSVMADILSTDAVDGKVGDRPYRLYVGTTSHKSSRGRVQDFALAHTAAAVGSIEPTSGPPYQSAIAGNIWIPWHHTVGPSL